MRGRSPDSNPEPQSKGVDADRAARRLRRAQRRAKQREQNVVRARDMHQARLAYERLHPPELVQRSGGQSQEAVALQAYVGCSGWFYWHWRGSFYPQDLPGSAWFARYATAFRTVELNAPFYSWPTLATIGTWQRQVGRRKFVYTIKVNELITHVRRFSRSAVLVKDFGLIADLLGPRFGCFLFQLPPSFKYSAAALRRIVAQLDPRRRNVVEFRHRSWWNDDVYRAFADHNIVFCSVSAPRLPDDIIKTTGDVYVRFHGPQRWYRHDYSNAELSTWSQRIRDSGATRVWAYFNNDRQEFAIKNARALLRMLKRG